MNHCLSPSLLFLLFLIYLLYMYICILLFIPKISYMYIMYLDHIHHFLTTSSSNKDSTSHLLPTSWSFFVHAHVSTGMHVCMCVCINPLSPIGASQYTLSMAWDYPQRHGEPISGHTAKENWLLFPYQPSTANSYAARMESWELLSLFCWNFLLAWHCAGLVYVTTTASSCIHQLCHV